MENENSLTQIINEEDFLPLVTKQSGGFLSLLQVIKDKSVELNKLYYFTLTQEADLLESFLDDHGARGNLQWLFYSELVACVRNFAFAGFQIYHILDRYPDYLRGQSDQLGKDFQESSYETLNYFSDVLGNFCDAMLAELEAHGASTEQYKAYKDGWVVKFTPQLPYTIKSKLAVNEEERIISMAQSYRKVVKYFKLNRLDRRIKSKNLAQIIPAKLNESLMADMEGQLHSLQSEYDTYVRGGAAEKANNDIPALRGLTAIPMHLIEALKWLTHFYERHESEIRKTEVTDKIANLVQNERLLKCIVDYGLHYCSKYLNHGAKVAEAILSSYVKPIKYELPIPKPHGFHARPATYVSLVVQEHGTDVFLLVNEERFDCRSVLDMLQAGGMLADMKRDTVTMEGDKRVLDDLVILANHNYCEDQDIPTELSYIRIMRNL